MDTHPTVDGRWDEMDHLAVLAAQERAQPRDFDGEPDARQFQAWFEKATGRWLSGEHDGEYAESWPEFRDRVLAGLDALGDGTTVVVTSGGPISIVVAHLLESSAAYQRIAPVVVNASSPGSCSVAAATRSCRSTSTATCREICSTYRYRIGSGYTCIRGIHTRYLAREDAG